MSAAPVGSAFNVDRLVAARPRWTCVLGGVARVAAALAPADLAAYCVANLETTREGLAAPAVWQLWRRAFPWRWSYLRDGDPARLVCTLPAEYRDGLTFSLFQHEVAVHATGRR